GAVGFALGGHVGGPASTNAIGKPAQARARVDAGGVRGSTREWCEGLVEQADRIRLAFFSLEGGRNLRSPDHGAPLDRLKDETSDLVLSIALALELPLARRRIAPRLVRTRAAFDQAISSLPPSARLPLEEAASAVEALAGSVEDEWPIGPGRAETSVRAEFGLGWARNLHRHQDPDRLFRRHAIRLSILIVLATAIAEYAPSTHTYWLPLTVAWITKPDLSGTAERVVGRIAGTVLGLAVFGAIALTVGPDQPVMLLLFTAGVIVSVAGLPANYAICVAGWTPAVLALISLDFPEVTELIGPRLVETTLGGALVIAVATIWPTRLTEGLARGLAMAARALRHYGDAIRSGHEVGRTEARVSVMAERAAAAMLVQAAAH
ncbi:MAG: FUSC family protein, partial [Solirubrobacterales bacterium]